jgi:hypothetical protein
VSIHLSKIIIHKKYILKMSLPQEVWLKVLDNLSPEELMHFCESSNDHSYVCSDKVYMRRRYLEDFGDIPAVSNDPYTAYIYVVKNGYQLPIFIQGDTEPIYKTIGMADLHPKHYVNLIIDKSLVPFNRYIISLMHGDTVIYYYRVIDNKTNLISNDIVSDSLDRAITQIYIIPIPELPTSLNTFWIPSDSIRDMSRLELPTSLRELSIGPGDFSNMLRLELPPSLNRQSRPFSLYEWRPHNILKMFYLWLSKE